MYISTHTHTHTTIKTMLIKVQHDATVCRHLFSVTSLYMFRVSCTHHQEYYKLYLLPLVYVMVMVPLLPSSVA